MTAFLIYGQGLVTIGHIGVQLAVLEVVPPHPSHGGDGVPNPNEVGLAILPGKGLPEVGGDLIIIFLIVDADRMGYEVITPLRKQTALVYQSSQYT